MFLGICLSICLMFSLAACTDSGTEDTQEDTGAAEEAEEAESSDESEDSDDEEDSDSDSSYDLILSLDDGTEVELAELDEDEAYIYGKYYYESDGSMWVFGGYSLSVGYYDEDGNLDVDIYDLGFYEAVDGDDDTNYLYLVLTDVLEGTSACWYAANVTDDDGNVEGIALINPSDESYYYYLTIYEDDDDEDDEDEDEEDEDEDSSEDE